MHYVVVAICNTYNILKLKLTQTYDMIRNQIMVWLNTCVETAFSFFELLRSILCIAKKTLKDYVKLV
jgi:hypothetical protein